MGVQFSPFDLSSVMSVQAPPFMCTGCCWPERFEALLPGLGACSTGMSLQYTNAPPTFISLEVHQLIQRPGTAGWSTGQSRCGSGLHLKYSLVLNYLNADFASQCPDSAIYKHFLCWRALVDVVSAGGCIQLLSLIIQGLLSRWCAPCTHLHFALQNPHKSIIKKKCL